MKSLNWQTKLARASSQPGLASFTGKRGEPLFIGLFANLQTDAGEFCSDENKFWNLIKPRATKVELITAESESELLKRFVALLNERQPEFNLVLKDESRYPHFKINSQENFPRLMVTRRIRDDGANYFGPFLPDSKVRRLLDLLNRVFKLRSCELEIDGSFIEPCGEYFSQRCLAPCVARLCGADDYADAVKRVETFLAGDLPYLIAQLDLEVAAMAERLDFERASELRDLRETFNELMTDRRWRLDLEGATDVFVCRHQSLEGQYALGVQLETLRLGKVLGEKIFFSDGLTDEAASDYGQALAQILPQWYGDYFPDKIIAPVDFAQRRLIRSALSQLAGRKIEIAVAHPDKLPPMTKLAMKQAELAISTRFIAAAQASPQTVLAEIAQSFGLKAAPQRIETFDVAHISGTQTVAAMSVCLEGKLQSADGVAWALEEMGEPAAMAEAIKRRFALLSSDIPPPDLVLLDGGRSQLNAVTKALNEIGQAGVATIAIVKPPRRHNQISHLISGDDPSVKLQLPADSSALRLIQQLRDEAHRLANEFHRKRRDLDQLITSATPLLAPTRLDEPGGDAEDLRPIRSLDHSRMLLANREANQSTGDPAGKPKGKRRSNSPFALKSLTRKD